MELDAFTPAALDLDGPADLSVTLDTPQATARLGQALGASLEPGAFVGLVGDLGAGKTTLVQHVVAALDPKAHATSPTYTLVNRYETTRPPVAHIDLYRLDGYDELESIGYWDVAESDHAVVFVEWLNRIVEAWPGQGLLVVLERHGEGRRARIWADGARAERVVSNLAERLERLGTH